MDYRGMIEEIGALAAFYTGWSKADLMDLPVRERRYWIRQATYIVAQRERARNGR